MLTGDDSAMAIGSVTETYANGRVLAEEMPLDERVRLPVSRLVRIAWVYAGQSCFIENRDGLLYKVVGDRSALVVMMRRGSREPTSLVRVDGLGELVWRAQAELEIAGRMYPVKYAWFEQSSSREDETVGAVVEVLSDCRQRRAEIDLRNGQILDHWETR